MRTAVARAYRKSLGDVSTLLPEAFRERIWFAAVSVTAEVCEEVLCRGFMFRYLDGIALHLSLPPTLLLALRTVFVLRPEIPEADQAIQGSS